MRRFKRLVAVLGLAVAGVFALPAGMVQAMECINVPGLGCVYPQKHCINPPCN